MKYNNLNQIVFFIFVMGLFVLFGCKDISENKVTSITDSTSEIYPMVVDANKNGINDYVEKDTHLAEADSSTSLSMGYDQIPNSTNQHIHEFIDSNGDGICDFAQDGSHAWHGPGYVDDNDNGICDYYDENSSKYNVKDFIHNAIRQNTAG